MESGGVDLQLVKPTYTHRTHGEGVARNRGCGRTTKKKVLKKTPQLQLLGKNINIIWTAALDMTESGREDVREQ